MRFKEWPAPTRGIATIAISEVVINQSHFEPGLGPELIPKLITWGESTTRKAGDVGR